VLLVLLENQEFPEKLARKATQANQVQLAPKVLPVMMALLVLLVLLVIQDLLALKVPPDTPVQQVLQGRMGFQDQPVLPVKMATLEKQEQKVVKVTLV
jgi:hypothetical protein